eukprot:scpid110396/ scgid28143/ 
MTIAKQPAQIDHGCILIRKSQPTQFVQIPVAILVLSRTCTVVSCISPGVIPIEATVSVRFYIKIWLVFKPGILCMSTIKARLMCPVSTIMQLVFKAGFYQWQAEDSATIWHVHPPHEPTGSTHAHTH